VLAAVNDHVPGPARVRFRAPPVSPIAPEMVVGMLAAVVAAV